MNEYSIKMEQKQLTYGNPVLSLIIDFFEKTISMQLFDKTRAKALVMAQIRRRTVMELHLHQMKILSSRIYHCCSMVQSLHETAMFFAPCQSYEIRSVTYLYDKRWATSNYLTW